MSDVVMDGGGEGYCLGYVGRRSCGWGISIFDSEPGYHFGGLRVYHPHLLNLLNFSIHASSIFISQPAKDSRRS